MGIHDDPAEELKDRYNEIQKGMDPKEIAEREGAADAYSRENEKHFIDYLTDCKKQSRDASAPIRNIWSICWSMYNEEEPESYANKEAWQSRIIVPRPFETVQYGASAVKKAFSPDFLSIVDEKNTAAQEFWKSVMTTQTDSSHGNFTMVYHDALIMALACGQSMEMIPSYTSQGGLTFTLVEPWKICRDPDAPPRDCQGGLFWIHSEWLDWFVLKKQELDGKYRNVDAAKDVSGESTADPFMSREAIAARKSQIWQRSAFRSMILTDEFYGVVLDPKGNLLLPKARYTVAGNRVIMSPRTVEYATLRWPGISFSPIPSILTHGGRGLLQGVISIWEALCNMMNLHHDGLSWMINSPTEINIDALDDPSDVDDFPGKRYLTRDTVSGAQAVRQVKRRDVTNSVLANGQYYDQLYQHGSMVNDGVQGLPGYRQDMTWRESQQNLSQSLGVYTLMGQNLEDGAGGALKAAQDVVSTFAGYRDYTNILDDETVRKSGIVPDTNTPNGVANVPKLSGRFHVSGITALMKDAETLSNLKSTVIPMADSPTFGPYVKVSKLLKALERRTNMSDEGIFVDDATAEIIDYIRNQKLTEIIEQLKAERLKAQGAANAER